MIQFAKLHKPTSLPSLGSGNQQCIASMIIDHHSNTEYYPFHHDPHFDPWLQSVAYWWSDHPAWKCSRANICTAYGESLDRLRFSHSNEDIFRGCMHASSKDLIFLSPQSYTKKQLCFDMLKGIYPFHSLTLDLCSKCGKSIWGEAFTQEEALFVQK